MKMKHLKMSKLFFFVLLVICYSTNLLGQNSKFLVSGVITELDTQETLFGVGVKVKSTNEWVHSNVRGEYKIEVGHEKDTLIYSYVGYEIQRIPVRGRKVINVEMNEHHEIIYETLICNKNLLESSFVSSNYFPYGFILDYESSKLLYCCEISHILRFQLSYQTDLISNDMLHASGGIEKIKFTKNRLGLTFDFNKFRYSLNGINYLFCQYKINIVMVDFFKNFKSKIGLGKEVFQNTTYSGFGGSFSYAFFVDKYPSRFKLEALADFWTWEHEQEYKLGLNLFYYINPKKNYKFFRRIKLGCDLNKIYNLTYFSFSIGVKLVIKNRYVGCS